MIDPRLHKSGASLSPWLLCLALCPFAGPRAEADKAANWQIFRNSDGLKDSAVSAISLSPRGNLWIKHSEANEISFFDGYTFGALPSPGKNNFRIYESRSGQLWSIYPEGLTVFDATHQVWVQHPIREIRGEIQADPLRQIRQISLVPAERDHVFFLVADQLMEYDAARLRANVIRRALDTKLGRFFEMVEARDGGIWITGARGLGYISGPVRRLTSATIWQEFLANETIPVENLQRPFEDERGGITALAASSLAPGKRAIVHFDGSRWTHQAVTNEVLRQAWMGWDQTTWGYTITSLLRFDRLQPDRYTREGTAVGQYKDVLTETNGNFWLGTSEGLLRYAPFLWRTPDETDDLKSLVHALLEDPSGRLWFASTEGLLQRENQRWKLTHWPESFEVNFVSSDGLFALPDGRIAIAAGENPLLFDPATGAFKNLTHPEGRRIRLVGQFKGGALAVQSSGNSDQPNAPRLEEFQGHEFRVWHETNSPPQFPREIYVVFTAQNGDVWLGGTGGLLLVRDSQAQSFGPPEGFKDDRALCLIEMGEGKIWCGGSDRIQEFNGKTWSTVRSRLDRVNHMTRTRDGKVWVATNRGLHAFANGYWMSHSLEEGLPSAAVSAVLEDRKNQLWAGTTRGLTLFRPETDSHPPRTLAPVVAEMPSSDGSVKLLLNGTDKWHNTAPERLLFSYRLDESPWSLYTNITAKTFENLGSGQHRFEARAMDRNWNEDTTSQWIEFLVVVPWYREPRLIAVIISGLILVLLFAALAVNRHIQLIRSYAEVEKIVAIRTRELERANEELLHSQKMKALGTLAAGIAHDFNNILSIIKGSAQIIERNVEDKEKIRTRVSRIKTVVEQGSGLVKSMLGLSRVTEKNFLICDLAALVNETIKLLTDRFQPDVTIRFITGPALPPIRTIKELIQQMLYNLVLNAVDAMTGAGEIVLRAEAMEVLPDNLSLAPSRAGTYVSLAVEDSGIGIAPDLLPRIFEPFFTTKALSTRRGTGLGLSMVYELAKEMGYGLHVHSEIGKGTIFTILIPAGSAETLKR